MAKTKTVRVSMQWTHKKSFLIAIPEDVDEQVINDLAFDCEDEFREHDRHDVYPDSIEYGYFDSPDAVDIPITISIIKICSDEECFQGYLTCVEEATHG